MMVKNHIFFYIHLVMIVCSAFGGWQKRMDCVDHMRRMRCPGYSAPQYSVFSCWLALLILCLVLFYCVVVNVVFGLMVEKEKRRLWCTNQEIFSTPVELKEQIEWTGVVLIVYGWQHSYFNNRCYYLWIYTDDTPAK